MGPTRLCLCCSGATYRCTVLAFDQMSSRILSHLIHTAPIFTDESSEFHRGLSNLLKVTWLEGGSTRTRTGAFQWRTWWPCGPEVLSPSSSAWP